MRLNLGIWNERGDRIGRHNLPDAPMLDPLTGAAFVIGAGLVLTRLRDGARCCWRCGWAWHLCRASSASRHPTPSAPSKQSRRRCCWLPFCIRTLATTMDDGRWTTWLLSIVRRPSSKFVLAGGLLLAALALNGVRYFVAWPHSPQAYEEFFVAETHAGELIQRLVAQPKIQADGYQIYAGQCRTE